MNAPTSQLPASRMAVWFTAIRPKTLIAAIAPVGLGTALAVDAGGFHVWSALCALAGALLIQIGTNLSNDYVDNLKGADTEERKGPLRVTQAGLVEPGSIRRATILAFTLAFLCGLYLIWRGGWPILVIGLCSILAGVLYTTGRYSLAYLGLGDLFVLVFFGPVAVGGTFYVQVGTVNTVVLVAGLTTGLLATAILLVNNIRDVEEDRAAGKKTLVVRFGKSFGIGLWTCCVVVAALIPLELLVATGAHRWAAVSVLILIPALHVFERLRNEADPAALNPMLGKTALILLAHTVLFSVGWML